MDQSFVQGNSNFSAASANSWTVAFPDAVTAGNMIVVAVAGAPSGTADAFSVTDTLGTSYSQAVTETTTLDGVNFVATIFWGMPPSGGSNTVTIAYPTASGTTSYNRQAIHEYSGVNQLDQTTSGSGTSNAVDAGSVTTTQADEILFGWLVSNAGMSGPGTGFTLRETAGSEITEDKIVTATGTYDITGNGNYTDAFMALGATFYGSGGGSNGGGGGGSNTGGLITDTPENHGAKRDGTTDDTVAINAAIANVVNLAKQNGSYYGEVIFTPGTYAVNGSPSPSADGNAIIVLPNISPLSGEKFTLVLKGTADAGSLPYWSQTVPQASGVVLSTTVTGSNSAALGPTSVVGGPTPEQGYGGGSGNGWSNMLIVLDGITVQAPNDPTICAFDFRGIAEAKVLSASALVTATPASTNNNPTNTWTFGLAMPITNNNDYCDVLSWSCEGFGVGFMPSEHTIAYSVRSIYCWAGISANNGGVSMPHSGRIHHASVEACSNILVVASASGLTRLNIDMLDVESSGLIWDGNNLLWGTINICYNAQPSYGNPEALAGTLGGGGEYLRLISNDYLPGHVASTDSVPASGTAYTNGYMRDAAVTVSGGSVTDIAVDGISTGSASGTVVVPAGKTLTLTYSTSGGGSAPSWVWTLL